MDSWTSCEKGGPESLPLIANSLMHSTAIDKSLSLAIAPIPAILRERSATLDDALRQLTSIGSEHRQKAFLTNLSDYKNRPDYEDLLIFVWATGEVGDCKKEDWAPAFEAANIDKLKRAGDKLPFKGRMIAYRGCQNDTETDYSYDLSWTLSKNKAEWFATTQQRVFKDGLFAGFSQPVCPTVYVASFVPDDIYFYYNGRKEKELVVKPDRFPDYATVEKHHLPNRNNPMLFTTSEALMEFSKAAQEIGDFLAMLGHERGMNTTDAWDVMVKCKALVDEGKAATLSDTLEQIDSK